MLTYCLEKNVVFNDVVVQSSLPLPPGETISIDVVIMPEESWMFCTNKDKLEVSVTINYSCEEDTSDVYNREASWVTYVKVMPSLEFSNVTFSELERYFSFCFVYMIEISIH